MSRIAQAFARRLAVGGKVLIPFLPLGYPTLAATGRAMDALVRAGADLIEVGMPFSDSLADGPTIQVAYHEALDGGLSVGSALDFLEARRGASGPPVVLMCCYNLIHRMGVASFAIRARQSGIDGVIAPDLPLEESSDLRRELASAGVSLVGLVAPTTPLARVRKIARFARGFVYYVSRKGVTGVRGDLGDVTGSVTAVKARSRLPVVVGFGISTPDLAREVARPADGVVVGSALVELTRVHGETEGTRLIEELVGRFRRALDGGEAGR